MITFSELPAEILLSILSFSLTIHPRPGSILRINKRIRSLSEDLLYEHLIFTSINRIDRFCVSRPHPFPCLPRKLSVNLPGGQSAGAFGSLLTLTRDLDPSARQALETIEFCFNSLSFDPNPHHTIDSLKAFSPISFKWVGPDPEHHFSLAIVPKATTSLLHIFMRGLWSRIRHLTLTHISFPHGEAYIIPPIPSLVTMHIGQVTHLHPLPIAMFAVEPRNLALEKVTLIDAYVGSIWGPRVRRSDILRAIRIHLADQREETILLAESRIRDTVVCMKQTERIEGGDRVDGSAILD